MNIAYIKMDKPKGKKLKEKIKYKIRAFFDYVYKDKYTNNYYISNVKEKTKNKLLRKLRQAYVDYIIEENGININYPKLDGKYTLKFMLPEVVKYCFKLTKAKIEEIFICTNTYSNENIEIIKDLSKNVKVVNIITENSRYLILERELEKEGIYITVNNNKRKSLKKAGITINLDFKDFKEYNINRNMIIIDIKGNLSLNKSFEGIYIKKAKITTSKVMRVFSEYEKFKKEELIEAEMIKLDKYKTVREYVNINKFTISEVIGTRKISKEEFKRIEQKTA